MEQDENKDMQLQNKGERKEKNSQEQWASGSSPFHFKYNPTSSHYITITYSLIDY